MNELTEQNSAQHQQADETTRPPARPVPGIIRHEGPGTRWGQSHVNGVALIRLLAVIWLVVLGSIFCASGHWWGACFFVVAGLVGWLAYKLPRSRARE
jgi:hypothetical protein